MCGVGAVLPEFGRSRRPPEAFEGAPEAIVCQLAARGERLIEDVCLSAIQTSDTSTYSLLRPTFVEAS
jgi:hypothetical protein